MMLNCVLPFVFALIRQWNKIQFVLIEMSHLRMSSNFRNKYIKKWNSNVVGFVYTRNAEVHTNKSNVIDQ